MTDGLATTSADDFPPPVFVLAAPGLPGQTLAAALGQNPGAFDLPELNLEQMATIDVLRREMIGIRAVQLHGLFRAIGQLYAGEQTAASVEMAGRWLSRRSYLSTAAVAREFAARIAPRRMVLPVTASILDRASLRRLRAAFPRASYLHLHLHPHQYGRHLMASANGQIVMQLSGAVDESTQPPTPDPQELWLMAETAIAAFTDDLGPQEPLVSVRAEDLARAPGPLMTELARALGLAEDAAALRAMLSPERSVFRGPGPMGAHAAGNIQSLADLAASLPEAASARLEGAVPWRADGVGLREEVRARARALGYGDTAEEPPAAGQSATTDA